MILAISILFFGLAAGASLVVRHGSSYVDPNDPAPEPELVVWVAAGLVCFAIAGICLLFALINEDQLTPYHLLEVGLILGILLGWDIMATRRMESVKKPYLRVVTDFCGIKWSRILEGLS